MLTNSAISNAKAKKSLYRLNDGRGLCIEVTPSSSKRWRYRYRFDGKAKMLSLGIYPTVTLKEARARAEDCRKLLSEGLDPSAARREEEAVKANTFQAVAEEWLEKHKSKWSEKHAHNLRYRLEHSLFPEIGALPINAVTPPALLAAVRKVEARGALEQARRSLQTSSQIFRYAIACGYAERDPAQDLRGALAPANPEHRAAITDPKELAHLLRDIDEYSGSFVTVCALKLLPMLFVRPGELRHAEWSEFDLEGRQWRIPSNKMKMKTAHIVPLSVQAMDIIESLRRVTGEGKYLFPGPRTADRPMSENTLNAALRRLGYTKEQVCSHGLRGTALTMLNEQGWPSDVIERQLAHVQRNKVRACYNHAEYLPERTRMMQAWSDYLDVLKSGAKVTPLFARQN